MSLETFVFSSRIKELVIRVVRTSIFEYGRLSPL